MHQSVFQDRICVNIIGLCTDTGCGKLNLVFFIFLGSVTLGIKSSGEALRHWFETLNTSDRRVTRWHALSFFMPSGMEDD